MTEPPKPPTSSDPLVNHPPHYTVGGIETIDYLKAKLGPAGYEAYLLGCAIKYLSRYQHKEKARQDLEKAQWYVNRLVEIYQDAS